MSGMPLYSPENDADGQILGYIRSSDGAFVPADPRNMDYQDVIRWIAENTAS